MTGEKSSVLDDVEFRWMGSSARKGGWIDFEQADIAVDLSSKLQDVLVAVKDAGFGTSAAKVRLGRALRSDGGTPIYYLDGHAECEGEEAYLVVRPVRPSDILEPSDHLTLMMGESAPEVDVELDSITSDPDAVLAATRWIVTEMRPRLGPLPHGPDVEAEARAVADRLRELHADLPFDVPRIVVFVGHSRDKAWSRRLFEGVVSRPVSGPRP